MNERRPQFGSRFLRDESLVYEFNAWDDVQWSEEQELLAKSRICEQRASAVSACEARCLRQNAAENWDAFYRKHCNKFFMHRNWLLIEFPELDITKRTESSGAPLYVLDVGCGVGNATIPLLHTYEMPDQMFIYACDYSREAVDILTDCTKQWSDRCKVFVWDITESATDIIPEQSLDIILCIYVLSAIPPEKQQRAVENLARLLKPGGVLLLKDYAQFDMTQLRFKRNRLIDENFYRRGDGTLVYFFTQDKLDSLLTGVGLKKEINMLDRRLIVNRAKRLKMYRLWVQCKYVKCA